MSPQVDIRSATRADVPVLVTLVEQYWKFEAIEGFDAARITMLFDRVAAQPSLGQAWIATVDGTPAGYLFAVFVFSLEYQGLTAEIDELYVMPQYRGLGLGTKLLANAEDAFRQGGCTVAFLQIGRDNDDARTFYRRHGYADRAGFELVDKKL